MTERLISGSGIKLYGRKIVGITLEPDELAEKPRGANGFLNQQVKHKSPATEKPILARIYGYSYNGAYYELSFASIFLVHGEGGPAAPEPAYGLAAGKKFSKGGSNEGDDTSNAHASPPGSADQSGVGAKSWDFVDDMRCWEYDKGDFLLRLDMSSGPLEQILLEQEFGGDFGEGYYGGNAGISSIG